MPLTTLNNGAVARRLALLTTAAVMLALAGCASDDDAASTGTAFTQALGKDYSDLGNQAAALPAPEEPSGMLDSLDVLGLFSGGNPNDALAKAFDDKADTANGGEEPDPEAAPADPAGQAIRTRLVRDLAGGKAQFPTQAARAQADYDCWILATAVPSAAAMGQACRSSLDGSLAALEGGARPAPPPSMAPMMPLPAPAPVQSAPEPAPAPAPAPATNNYTVYFNFDSWTLTAEDLKVITDAINAARTGGEGHITIVGHTDTSGPADYNMKLSVRRANVVVEAMVDMGARRAAIQASGVGETDLAVPTPDGVKEAKNRRSVITLQP